MEKVFEFTLTKEIKAETKEEAQELFQEFLKDAGMGDEEADYKVRELKAI